MECDDEVKVGIDWLSTNYLSGDGNLMTQM